ncbi:fimbrial biogenesis outer membrane usher protein [Pantoea anthophila]|nr:fimbria/pilus outer membrane usher protein [Pantoea anthophila]MEB5705906.1 fimbrial biogenesis outer membrane usher protein [Pantoea anthophila]MEB6516759.1 fimbrial biogenesis outer membrane usher protein [Pantoea anthophila]
MKVTQHAQLKKRKYAKTKHASSWLAGVPGVILMVFCPLRAARADDYFNPAALEFSSDQHTAADLHYFAREGGQQPGTYHVSLLLNNKVIDSRDVSFVEGKNGLIPQLTVADLSAMGVNVEGFSAFSHLKKDEAIAELGDYIPDASSDFDFAHQQLNLSIPQIALKMKDRDYVDPASWDEGVSAAFVDYNLSGSSGRNQNDRWNSTLLSLRSGANLGAWRLRNTSSWRYDLVSHWQSQTTWLERDLKTLKSQFRVGDTYTSGDVFDSVQFRGVQMMSDDTMLPESQRGFAPVIHGIAHSNARVTVSQQGYVIYETVVAPGAFEIKDLYPTAQSGDLDITIHESDGSVRTFTQPYSAVPYMLRQGHLKYSVSGGRYHYSGSHNLRSPEFVQSTLFYGLPHDFTAFGGVQLAQNYHAAAAGLGKSLGDFGSLGMDVTFASTRLPQGLSRSGQSVRAQYQKNFASTNTTFSMASYRYSSSGFYAFSEANALTSPASFVDNKRSRSEIAVSQGIGDAGSLSASAYMQRYWRSNRNDRTLHLGFYSNYKAISWGVAWFYTDSTHARKADRAISFNISVPLSALLPDSSVSYSMNASNRGDVSQQIGLSGSALQNNNLHYTLQQGHDSQGQNVNSSGSLDYRGSQGSVSVGVGHDRHSTQYSYGLSGGIVAHAHGVTLSQPLGDTFAIVRVPDTANVGIQSGSNVFTDGRGYAIVPSLSPYHENAIELETETLPDNVDVELDGQTAIPTRGAIVLADYATHVGNRVLFTLTWQHTFPPFGATGQIAIHAGGNQSSTSGIVAEKGELYLSGVPAQGTVEVKWQEEGKQKSCRAPFRLSDASGTNPVRLVSAVCQ